MRKPVVQVLAFAIVVLGILGGHARADASYDLLRAKGVISRQLELIKQGNVDELKVRFTDRLQGKITDAAVKKAQASVGKLALDELVASVVRSGDEHMEVKRKDGRTLTTLIRVDGTWLADTLWFQ